MTMSDYDLTQHINADEEDLKNRIFEKVYGNQIKETPLKSVEEQTQEAKKKIDDNFQFIKEDFVHGFELLFEDSDQEHKEILTEYAKNGKILLANFYQAQDLKKQGEESVSALAPEEMENIYQAALDQAIYFDNLARHRISIGNNKEAISMFRFIINNFFVYTPAWVGWAVAENEMGNAETTKYIYELCLQMFPEDSMVAYFASIFYLNNHENDKAKQLLLNAKKRLEDQKAQNSEIYKNINKLLNQ